MNEHIRSGGKVKVKAHTRGGEKQTKIKKIDLFPNITAEVDVYRCYEGQGQEPLYAFHVYKGKKYKGTYILNAKNSEIAIRKLKNNEVKRFAYNGGYRKEFKSVKELAVVDKVFNKS